MQPPPDPVVPLESRLQCDLVMKGGITSGLVYPRAMARVARDYRIRSIGGTSIGAIAAALTAAAEYWRQANTDLQQVHDQQEQIDILVTALNTQVDETSGWEVRDRSDIRQAEDNLLAGGVEAPGFAGLYAIPRDIGSDLTGKFQPERSTAGAFRFLIAVLDARHPITRLTTILTRQFLWFRLATAIVFGLLTLAFVRNPLPVLWTLLILVAGALLFVGVRRVMSLLSPPGPEPAPAPAALPPEDAAGIAPSSPEERDEPSSTTGRVAVIMALVAAVVLLLWAIYVQVVIGWPDILRWIGNHLPFMVGTLLLALLLTQADVVRDRVLTRLPSDPGDTTRRERWRHLLDVGLLATGLVLAVLLVIFNWQTLKHDPDTTGPVVVGATVGWVLGVALGLAANAAIFIPANFTGICTGMGNRDALTPWLTRRINTVAGLDPDGSPLTFGQLSCLDKTRRITLEMIASDLTRGVPLDLPAALHRYRFRPCEFRRLFPPSVLEQLKVTDPASKDLHPFPPVACIPVVVAARMSMSFPVLFSAVPVYFNDGTAGAPDLRCLLSDGGIISNFPVHKFDRSLPGWPTFAIDLIDEATGPAGDLYSQVWVNPIRPVAAPEIAQDAAVKLATAAIPMTAGDNLAGLLIRIVNTARGWMDNSQKALPGYRERIVGIRLYPGEGGLNLTMSASTIDRLAHRGMYGIHLLLELWNPDPDPIPDDTSEAERLARSQWHQHRWLRYRIIMRSLENIGQEWHRRYALPPPGTAYPSIADLVAETNQPNADRAPAGMAYHWTYWVNGGQAADLTARFNAFAEATPDQMNPVTGEQVPGYFDQPVAPEVEPKSLMMPPFE